MPIEVSDEELKLDVSAYYDAGGNKSEASRMRGLKRRTYLDRLAMAEKRFGVQLGKVADGRIDTRETAVMPLPKKGHIRRYLLTSIQNNTHLHPSFNNIIALNSFLDGLPKASCELIIGTYSYQINAYGPKATKRGKHKDDQGALWYDPEAEPFIRDDSVELAPGLVWCGEQNILPTAKRPLTDFETYNGRKSNIVPHSRIQMESVASMPDEATKLNFSTGTITQMNYIQKKAGILAEQRHDYGCLLVEVDDSGSWWVRQIYVGKDGDMMDIGPSELDWPGLVVRDGAVHEERTVEAISFGDAHASEMDLWVRELIWGDGGMVDTLRPRYQMLHDLFSMRSRSPHETKDFLRTFEKHVDDEESVEEELEITADLLAHASRGFCETVVVPSNHDRHLERWVNETDFRKDPLNAKFFCLCMYQMLDAIERGDKDFSLLEWAMGRELLASTGKSLKEHQVLFLSEDESFVVCDVEHGLHGDLGLNGARGSTRSLTKMGRGITKGHDHTAAIMDDVFSGGACALRFPYMKGPSSHSVSHVPLYTNGERTIVTMFGGKYRA